MNTQKCPYCGNDIEPLDNHAAKVVADKPIETERGPIPMQTVSCILTRCYIVDAKRPKSA